MLKLGMGNDPASCLAAALNEAEETVRANLSYSWHELACGYAQGELGDPCTCDVPEHVLALVATHRTLLEQHTPEADGSCPYCHYGMTSHDSPCWTVKVLAGAYGWTETP